LKTDVSVADIGDALVRPRDAGWIAIDAHDGAGWSGQIGREHRHVANTATQIENTHARPNSSGAKSTGQKSAQDRALLHKALAFAIGRTHGVVAGLRSRTGWWH